MFAQWKKTGGGGVEPAPQGGRNQNCEKLQPRKEKTTQRHEEPVEQEKEVGQKKRGKIVKRTVAKPSHGSGGTTENHGKRGNSG